ncbi:putative leader peptide [Streptomyces sp. Amel2xC10]|uniref:putative leader peptide n=1 Tax=Streptomyces sp. Amel2xC10 TaxID=1305826 RepID=UPI003565588C
MSSVRCLSWVDRGGLSPAGGSPSWTPARPVRPYAPFPLRPHGDSELTGPHRHGVLRIVTDTDVRLWRRVHMDLVRYAGCVCRPSC